MSIFSAWATIQKLEAVVNDLSSLANAIAGTPAWDALVTDINSLVADFRSVSTTRTTTFPPTALMAGTGVLAIVSALFQLYLSNQDEIDGLLGAIWEKVKAAKAAAGV